jgi:nitrite reductase (NADH) small subunit
MSANPGWARVCALDDIAPLGSRVVASAQGDIALFRTADDRVFGLHDKCPHKGGPLSQGIVHGETVTCPLHGWKLGLPDGEAVAPDRGCAKTFTVKLEAGAVWLKLA